MSNTNSPEPAPEVPVVKFRERPHAFDLSAFDCPRCSAPSSGDFYGLCENCKQTLRDNMASDARDVQAAEYVPKMNVTPNAVALKDN